MPDSEERRKALYDIRRQFVEHFRRRAIVSLGAGVAKAKIKDAIFKDLRLLWKTLPPGVQTRCESEDGCPKAELASWLADWLVGWLVGWLAS